jgi:transcriptional regulator with PAS, ATPase and Fis domain
LGGTKAKQADVLIVAATNKAYHPLVQQHALREDFFYRICVIEIQVPPLRERKEDISLLIEHFLNLYHRKQQQRQPEKASAPAILSGQVFEALYTYDWPGNIRELQNVLQRYLATQHLDATLPLIVSPDGSRVVPGMAIGSNADTLSDAVKAFEKQMIADALLKNQQNLSKTAASLKVPFSTLHRKVKQYRLRKDD